MEEMKKMLSNVIISMKLNIIGILLIGELSGILVLKKYMLKKIVIV